MKMSVSKIFNESNHTKFSFNQKNKCTCHDITDDVKLNLQNIKTYYLQYTNSNNNNK